MHEQTIVKTLRKLGIQRVPSEQAVCVERKASARRYGYTNAHRRHEPEQDYSSSLTDAEWTLVRDLFENPHLLIGCIIHNTLPGFISPSGSSACLTARMAARLAGGR